MSERFRRTIINILVIGIYILSIMIVLIGIGYLTVELIGSL